MVYDTGTQGQRPGDGGIKKQNNCQRKYQQPPLSTNEVLFTESMIHYTEQQKSRSDV